MLADSAISVKWNFKDAVMLAGIIAGWVTTIITIKVEHRKDYEHLTQWLQSISNSFKKETEKINQLGITSARIETDLSNIKEDITELRREK